MSLAERRSLRIFTLCVLYVAQGIPWGFMVTTLPAYLTERQVSQDFIGAMVSFSYLPYSFKWIWGPLIDVVAPWPKLGRRRPWILFAQLMMALTLITMVMFDVTVELKLLAWMVFIHTIFNSMQDVAVDALAIELLDEEERGRANGLMFASKYIGGGIGGALMVTIVKASSLNVALVIQTAILVAIMFVPLLVRERGDAPPPRAAARAIVEGLGQAFSLRSALVAALLMLGINFANGVISTTGYALFITELEWDYAEYGRLSGGWSLIVGGSAAALTGFVVDRLGRRAVAATASCALAAGWLGFALLRDHWTSYELVWAMSLYQTAIIAIITVSLIAMCMDLSWERIGATQFTAYMALSNFSTALGQQYAADINKQLHYHGVYIAAAIIQLAVIPLLFAIDPGETRRKLPLGRIDPRGIVALLALLAFLVVMTVRASLKYL